MTALDYGVEGTFLEQVSSEEVKPLLSSRERAQMLRLLRIICLNIYTWTIKIKSSRLLNWLRFKLMCVIHKKLKIDGLTGVPDSGSDSVTTFQQELHKPRSYEPWSSRHTYHFLPSHLSLSLTNNRWIIFSCSYHYITNTLNLPKYVSILFRLAPAELSTYVFFFVCPVGWGEGEYHQTTRQF